MTDDLNSIIRKIKDGQQRIEDLRTCLEKERGREYNEVSKK